MATQTFFNFHPKIGEDEPILTTHIFQLELVQPPTRLKLEIMKLLEVGFFKKKNPPKSKLGGVGGWVITPNTYYCSYLLPSS